MKEKFEGFCEIRE